MATATEDTEAGTRLAPLWFAVLGPPILWAVRFGVAYVLVPYSCARGSTLLLQVISAATLLGIAAAGAVGWRQWHRAGKSREVEFGGAQARARFMAVVGILESAVFFLVVVTETLAIYFIGPCQTGGAPL